MAIIINKKLYVLSDDGSTYEQFNTVHDEIFLTADRIDGLFSYDEYVAAINSPVSQRVIKLYLLNKDETIKEDVSEYLLSGSVNFTYASGQVASANIKFFNIDGKWTPSPVRGNLWKGSKFRLDIGICYNDIVFWKKCGIFTPGDPTVDAEVRTVSFQMYDKFAMLDGTLGGNSIDELKIPVGTKIRTAIEMCLAQDKGNGDLYDLKPVLFPSQYESATTPYTITKTPNYSIGDIIKELAGMIFCDVYYNEEGYLTVSPGVEDLNFNPNTKPILWHYTENELQYSTPSFTVDYSKVINIVRVRGRIQGGVQTKGVATNTNPMSQANIQMTEPNPLDIEDTQIIGEDNCLSRAKYELSVKSRLGTSVNFKSIFIPHLVPNGVVMWDNAEYGFRAEKLVINSIDMDLSSGTLMSLSLSNMNEVYL